MTAVVGLDLSLRSSGISFISGLGTPYEKELLHTVATEGERAEPFSVRLARVQFISAETRRTIEDFEIHTGESVALAGIEAPAPGVRGGSVHDRSGVWWFVYAELAKLAPVFTIAPSTLKKYATGDGGSKTGKPAMKAAALEHEPELVFANTDEVDAHWIANLGARRLGFARDGELTGDRLVGYKSTGIKWPAK